MSQEEINTAIAEESTEVEKKPKQITAEQPITGETTEQTMARKYHTLASSRTGKQRAEKELDTLK